MRYHCYRENYPLSNFLAAHLDKTSFRLMSHIICDVTCVDFNLIYKETFSNRIAIPFKTALEKHTGKNLYLFNRIPVLNNPISL